ncbi:MAG: hypothetical protein IJ865_02910 [Clostridia bacterium]|nr:hypothetical protein [Clostridia bacterium]
MIVDMHTHIVYGVDDGAKDLDMSRAMLKRAAENGVQVICCTSHSTPGHAAFPWDDYLAHLEVMGQVILEEKLPLTLLTGSEILYTDDAADMARRGDIPTLAGKNAVLVEFLPITDWGQITRAAREFSTRGLQMVCAHVERYHCLHEDMDRLYELKEEYGVILQMNCSTILRAGGLMGDKFAKKALKAGLIDIAASDAHNVTERACNIGQCRTFLQKHYGEETARRLLEDTPQSILF